MKQKHNPQLLLLVPVPIIIITFVIDVLNGGIENKYQLLPYIVPLVALLAFYGWMQFAIWVSRKAQHLKSPTYMTKDKTKKAALIAALYIACFGALTLLENPDIDNFILGYAAALTVLVAFIWNQIAKKPKN